LKNSTENENQSNNSAQNENPAKPSENKSAGSQSTPSVQPPATPAKPNAPSKPPVNLPSTSNSTAPVLTQEQKQKIPPLKMKFSGVDPKGMFKLKFN